MARMITSTFRLCGFDGTHAVTVETHLRPATASPGINSHIFCYGDRISLLQNNDCWAGDIVLPEAAQYGTTSIDQVKANTRIHLALVFDGDELRLYKNGTRLDSTGFWIFGMGELQLPSLASNLGPVGATTIGAFQRPAKSHFHGQIDEVRISNIARYTEDFTPETRFAPDEHTLALYHFDEGGGDTLIDSSGNDHHGEIHGATWVRIDDDVSIPDTNSARSFRELMLIDTFSLAAQTLDAWDLRFTPDGRSVFINAYTSDRRNVVQHWNVETGEFLREFGNGAERAFDVSPDGLSLLTGDNDGIVRLWEVETGRQIRTFAFDETSVPEPGQRVQSVRYSQDGSQIVCGGDDGVLRVWNATTGELTNSTNIQGTIYTSFIDHEKDRIISTWGTSLRFWDLVSNVVASQDYPPGKVIHRLALSSDARHVLAAGEFTIMPGHVLFYDLLSESEPLELDQREHAISDIALSPNGHIAMTAAADGIVKLWDTQSATVIAELDLQDEAYVRAAFSNDGQLFVLFGSADKELSIWRVPDSIRELGGWQARDAANFALEFDGEDDYVDVPSFEFVESDAYTWETRVASLVNDASTRPRPLPLSVPIDCWGIMDLVHGDGFGAGLIGTDKTRYRLLPDEPAGNATMHVAIVYDGNTAHLFINGHRQSRPLERPLESGEYEHVPEGNILRLSNIYGGARLTFARTSLGAFAPGFFQGTIDEVRISNIARYTEDFTPETRFAPDEHTLALYHFDEGEGDTLIDSSGNDHHGEIHGATWGRVDVPFDSRRIAVERVFERGGRIGITTMAAGVPDRYVSFFEEIQPEEWSGLYVDLDGNEQVVESDLRVILSGLPDLCTLSLNDTLLNDEVLVLVAEHRGIKFLKLTDTAITDAGIAVLREHPSLQSLFLGGTELGDSGAAVLATIPNLKSLQLHRTQITNIGFEALLRSANNRLLMTLDRTKVTGDALRIVGELDNVVVLGLAENTVSDNDLAHLSSTTSLTRLFLHHTEISDQGLRHLEEIENLSIVELSATNVTEEGVMRLHAAIPDCTITWDGGILSPQGQVSTAVAPFDVDEAARYQAEWAEHLGVDVETTNSIGMTFRLIPPGEFLMGSTDEEAQQYTAEIARLDAVNNYAYDTRITYETPQHAVSLSRPFALGIHEVTQGQFEAVMQANPIAFSHGGEESGRVSNVDTSELPVETMSWIDTIEFCNRLSIREGLTPCYEIDGVNARWVAGDGYRLPTEAEWEFAARAGSTGRFFFGESLEQLDDYAWHAGNSSSTTHAVGGKLPNPFGLFDVYGNVWEFCYDSHDPGWYERSQVIDPLPPVFRSNRVARGGSYDFSPLESRSAAKGNWGPANPIDFIGFRIARSVGDAAQMPPQAASDRELAAWVLDHGGTATRSGYGATLTTLSRIDDLPSEPFLISKIDFHDQDLSAPEIAEEFARLINDAGPLDEIQLERCQLSPELMETLSRSRGIQRLILSLSSGIGHEGFEALHRINGLRYVDIRCEIDVADFETLARIDSLEELRCHLKDGGECLRHFVSHPSLNAVFMDGDLSPAGLEYLGQNTKITHLELAGVAGDRELFFNTLGSLQHLQKLRLTIDRVTSAELIAISQIVDLRDLKFSYQHDVEIDNWSPLANLTELEILHLYHTTMDDAGLVHVAQLSKLIQLSVHGTAVTNTGLEQLTDLNNLRQLDLRDTAVDGDAIPLLLELQSLVSLDLTGSQVTADGVARLREELPGCDVKWEPDNVTSLDDTQE